MPGLLITVRHPGPADFVLTALPELSRLADVTVLATDAGLRLLLDRGGAVIREANVRIVEIPPPTELDAADQDGAHRLLGTLEELFAHDLPDVFLRTTPASRIGVDELAPVALRNCGYRGRIHCLQDYYGVGVALEGIDAIGTVDEAAAALASARTGLRAEVLGWIGFEQYLSGQSYREARTAGRAALGLSEDEKLVLYAGICSGLPAGNDLSDFAQCLEGVARLNVRFALRTHPRCPPEEQRAYAELCRDWQDRIRFCPMAPAATFRQALASPDVVLSPASAFNLDALAFASTDPAPETQSVYTTGIHAVRALEALTGIAAPPTHLPGSGHFTPSYEDLGSVLEAALFDDPARRRVSLRAAELYRPDGRSAARLARFLGLTR